MQGISKLAWALIGAGLSIVVALVNGYLSTKAPDLVWQTFPPAQVATEIAEVSIYNVRVDNIGNKEAPNVQVYLALPQSGMIEDVQVKPSLVSIEFTKTRVADSAFQVRFPLLNAGEGSLFSLLVRQADAAVPIVEVRGSGVVGRVREGDEPSQFARAAVVFKQAFLVFAGFATAVVLAIKYGDFRLFLQRNFTRQIRALHAQAPGIPVSDETITQLLLSKTFRFHFNPSLSLDKFKSMRFGPNGAILDGGNKKETSWRVKDGLFEFVNANNEINSRFYYSPTDQIFYQLPDPDTAAVARDGIGDQYLMAVAQIATVTKP